jgi:anhydro-N-acetylmuramic acid kinase
MEQVALGMMSGTSLDGMDLAHCAFHEEEGRWSYRILQAVTIPYPAPWKERLRQAPILGGRELVALDRRYGHYAGRTIRDFMARKGIRPPVLIASHGHTVFHRPDQGYTFQLGSGAAIAAETGCPVACDFRSADVALGGQGAPLVPLADQLLFGGHGLCLNLGGFSNVSLQHQGSRRAFDICPLNLVINRLVREEGRQEDFGLPGATGGAAMETGSPREPASAATDRPALPDYDPEGRIARQGKVSPGLLQALDGLEYYRLDGPRSLGQEWVDQHLWPLLQAAGLPLRDKLRTYYAHAAGVIAGSLTGTGGSSVLVTGGGAHNLFFMELLRQALGERIRVIIPDRETVDFKEALCFAFLGVLRRLGRTNCLSSVTGCRRDHCGGALHEPC